MSRYCIKYRDKSPESPTFSLIVKAFSKAHAEEKFFDDEDGDGGWEIISIERVKLAK